MERMTDTIEGWIQVKESFPRHDLLHTLGVLSRLSAKGENRDKIEEILDYERIYEVYPYQVLTCGLSGCTSLLCDVCGNPLRPGHLIVTEITVTGTMPHEHWTYWGRDRNVCHPCLGDLKKGTRKL